ncbi:MAG: penicillin-binding protein 2 [Tolumonas sp.]|uniref:penicillin-binding protein 2 n=1 Tax=uncultured Tolumonas sp. TaxID=263765 RepID=UPI002A0A1083|nr:penicillin-binding protein 2 [uncultured Tolumonas sp.]MDD2841233.1 penicillin-binding protein 2 [Tolumonas sp.]
MPKTAFKNKALESALFARRVYFSVFVIILMVAMLLGNLYFLQVTQYQDYQTRSNDNRIKVIPSAPPRGLIFDRNGVLLAENQPEFSLEIIPEQVPNLKQTMLELTELLGLDEQNIPRLLDEARHNRKFNPLTLAEQLNEEQVAKFSVNQYRFPGCSIEAYLKRHYPYADVLTHALGYVARINVKDLQQLDKDGKLNNYAATHDIGKQGVEKYYEEQLHGQAGYQEVEVNNKGRVLRTLKYQPPVAGQDLYLSIDIKLQKRAYELMAGQKGGIIMMDPRDGSILAFVSTPSYDPNIFVRGVTGKEYSGLLKDPARPLINRISQGGYSPASTVKPLLSVMGLNEGAITPTYRYFGGPTFQIPGTARKFRDWRKGGHGWLDVYRAIEVSADTFFYDMAYRVGIDKIHDYMTRFGFGQYSGLDIEEESKGILPSREWKQKRHRQPWFQGDTISVGIGQGYWTATLIQLARAHSILTQHGRIITPHLGMAFGSGDKQQPIVPAEQDPIQVKDDNYWNVALQGMYLVNNGPEGSGRHAFAGTPYKSGGKSGTAQVVGMKENQRYDASKLKAEHRDNALFVTFAPFDNPRVVCALILENAGGGSKNAAPLARAMLDSYLLNKYDSPVEDDEVPAH